MKLQANIKCPNCGAETKEIMPKKKRVYFYACPKCYNILKPKPGECCIFCSYADVKCPAKQSENK